MEETEIESSHFNPPYISLYRNLGPIQVWIVDGEWVRTHRDREFTDFGTGLAFDCIPEDEWWLDEEAAPDEYEFFLDHMSVEYHLMQGGMGYDEALEIADRKEKSIRDKYEAPLPWGEKKDATVAQIVILMEVEDVGKGETEA